VGKRFSKTKTKMGFGGDQVLHSIRRTVATMLERARVPEGVAADLLGHEKRGATMSFGLYSGGSSMEQKRAAIEKLDYPS
jgi:integrase